MKKILLNQPLSAALSELEHTDEVLVTDAKFPRPDVEQTVDLALVADVPTFAEVFEALLGEFPIEQATAASETYTDNPTVATLFDERLPRLETIPHKDLVTRSHRARLIVRTAESSPYANVILRCGPAF